MYSQEQEVLAILQTVKQGCVVIAETVSLSVQTKSELYK